VNERRDSTGSGQRFSGEYLTLGMVLGMLWGLMLLGGNWIVGIAIGTMLGAILDWRNTKAGSR
jgi:hypothetical protein